MSGIKEKLKAVAGEVRTLEPAKQVVLAVIVLVIAVNLHVLYKEYWKHRKHQAAVAETSQQPSAPAL